MPRAKPYYPLASRKKYLQLKRGGWRPLQQTLLKPWEQRVVAKSIRTVIESGVGPERDLHGTAQAMGRIVPRIVVEIEKTMQSEMPKSDWVKLCQIMDWHIRQTGKSGGRLYEQQLEKIKSIAKSISPNSMALIEEELWAAREKFDIEKDRKYKCRGDFQQRFELQLKHDILHSIYDINQFLEATK